MVLVLHQALTDKMMDQAVQVIIHLVHPTRPHHQRIVQLALPTGKFGAIIFAIIAVPAL